MLSTKIMLEGSKSMTNIKENADILDLINLSRTSDSDDVDGKKGFGGKNIYLERWKVWEPRLKSDNWILESFFEEWNLTCETLLWIKNIANEMGFVF